MYCILNTVSPRVQSRGNRLDDVSMQLTGNAKMNRLILDNRKLNPNNPSIASEEGLSLKQRAYK